MRSGACNSSLMLSSLEEPGTESLAPPLSGSGHFRVELIRGRASVTSARAHAPLKLLLPRPRGKCASIFASSFGGGLVAGDRLELDAFVGPGAVGLLTTQSATKVYRSPDGRSASQTLRAIVMRDATLVIVPDPLMLFRDAVYRQRQDLEIEDNGALVLLDWLTSGRREHGERWAFHRFESRLDIRYAGDLIVSDGLLLSDEHGAIDSPFRLGRFHCLATIVVAGDRLLEAARRLCEEVDSEPIRRQADLIEVASPVHGGAVLRILGMNPEEVARCIRRKLGFLTEILGESPWARKW